MARVTVEDCMDKVKSPYELVLVAKERATQLNSGVEPTVSELTESAVYKLRKHIEQIDENPEEDEEVGDDFQNLYKGEISKSGTPILPSKRARKIPEKLKVLKEDIEELKGSTESSEPPNEEPLEKNEEGDVSLDELSQAENQTQEDDSGNPENNNS